MRSTVRDTQPVVDLLAGTDVAGAELCKTPQQFMYCKTQYVSVCQLKRTMNILQANCFLSEIVSSYILYTA